MGKVENEAGKTFGLSRKNRIMYKISSRLRNLAIAGLNEFLGLKLSPRRTNRISKALESLKNNEPLKKNCIVSASNGTSHIYIICTDYKIEVSDYHSFDSGSGYDHYQKFAAIYWIEENKTEWNGNDDEMLSLIQNILASKMVKISVREEE